MVNAFCNMLFLHSGMSVASFPGRVALNQLITHHAEAVLKLRSLSVLLCYSLDPFLKSHFALPIATLY